MRSLPKIPYTVQQKKPQILKLLGLQYTDDHKDGSLKMSQNIASNRYPYIATRNGRRELPFYHDTRYDPEHQPYTFGKTVGILNFDDKLCSFRGAENEEGHFRHDRSCTLFVEETMRTLEEGIMRTSVKEIGVVNGKLCVIGKHPTHIADNYLKVIDPKQEQSGYPNLWRVIDSDDMWATTKTDTSGAVMKIKNNGDGSCYFYTTGGYYDKYGDTTITNLTNRFRVGDIISVESGLTGIDNVLASVRIQDIEYVNNSYTKFTFPTEVTSEYDGVPLTLTIEHQMPNLSHMCSKDNRLYGCSDADQTLYVSAFGSPENFYDYTSGDASSYSVSVGTPGNFTGCISLYDSVYFFKEGALHIMSGDVPSNFTMSTLYLEGVKEGCTKSLQKVGNTVIYVGRDGVYTYSGGTSSNKIMSFGEINIQEAVAGVDGERYWLSYKANDVWHLVNYDMNHGVWIEEDNTHVVDFARVKDNFFFLDDLGHVWQVGAARNGYDLYCTISEDDDKTVIPDNERKNEFAIQFNEFIETMYGSYGSMSSIFGHKRYHKLILRTECPYDSFFTVFVREDDGEWKELETFTDVKDLKAIVVPIGRCDRYSIKIAGTGSFTLLNMVRNYSVGSEK